MKKYICSGIVLLIIVAAWNVNLSSKIGEFSDISLANIEALAYEYNNQDWDSEYPKICHTCTQYRIF
ncbi:MAG: NVEALA domain-containing protein [Dysgonamonadaceae bacterium]|jgi:hypothetical protein|nr:NVEALA domain-containing protein [Dysgonamonadaceae bacterium]